MLPWAFKTNGSDRCMSNGTWSLFDHDDVIKWKHFPRNWPFVRGIHRSRWIPHTKGQWHGALMFSLICVRINGWVNNREAGDLRRYRGHYDVIVMILQRVKRWGWVVGAQEMWFQCIAGGLLFININSLMCGQIELYPIKYAHLVCMLCIVVVVLWQRSYHWQSRIRVNNSWDRL